MAHYAFIDNQNKVVHVITGVDEHITQIDTDGSVVGGSSEAWEKFYESQPWHQGLRCKRTSYNAKGAGFRKNYAGFNFTYDEQRDAFIPPQPYTSWTLNEDTCNWEAPMPYPQDDKIYIWNEDKLAWQEITEKGL